MTSRLIPTLVLLACSVLWGLTWLPLKYFGTFGIEGPLVTLSAHGSVGLLSIPLLVARRRAWLAHWPSVALVAVFGGLANLAFAIAIVRGDVMRVMALFYLLPAWGVLLARFFLREPIDTPRLLSLLFALSGAFFVLGGPRMFVAPPSWIDAFAALSGLALAANNVTFRKTQAVSIPLKVAAVFAGSLVWGVVAVALDTGARPVTAPFTAWVEVVLFGLVWILLATAGTMFGVNHLEAGRSSILILMELVTAVASASLILGKMPNVSACAGGALILLSAMLEALRPTPAPAAATP